MTCGWMGVYRPVSEATLFLLPTVAVIPTFMMNFGGKLPILTIFSQFLENPPMFKENVPKSDPCFENYGPKNPSIWAARTRTLNMLCHPQG